MKLLIALALVPPENLGQAFEFLCENNLLPEEAQPVLDYFEDTWIGRLQLRRSRRPPRFPHLLWNCFRNIQENLPKTNNSIEGWHRSFEQQVSCNHPNIWKFISTLKREQSLNELKIIQSLTGNKATPARKKYRDSLKRIERILTQFNILIISFCLCIYCTYVNISDI